MAGCVSRLRAHFGHGRRAAGGSGRRGRRAVADAVGLRLRDTPFTPARVREAALAACHFLIDWLKTDAPFWKSEETPNGERWVEKRAEDDEATRGWR